MSLTCQSRFTRTLLGFSMFIFCFHHGISSTNLECPSCEKIHCNPRRPSKLKCPGGITTGICNCCPTCAKIEKDRCGGDFNYLGKCDAGLVCETENRPLHSAFQETFGEHHESTGICRKVPKQVGDEGLPSTCFPKCTPRYCRRNPKVICSAINVAESPQGCQGHCQHTSCRACRFLPDEPHCGTCNQDDYHCLKKFGKCMKRSVCRKNIFPCRKSKTNGQGKFVCVVPDCSRLS